VLVHGGVHERTRVYFLRALPQYIACRRLLVFIFSGAVISVSHLAGASVVAGDSSLALSHLLFRKILSVCALSFWNWNMEGAAFRHAVKIIFHRRAEWVTLLIRVRQNFHFQTSATHTRLQKHLLYAPISRKRHYFMLNRWCVRSQ